MYHALIVDDEKHVRQTISLLGMWAENNISAPLEADNGESALKILESTPVNIVLVDIKMPVMSGMEFLEIATKRFPNIKYIIISGFNDFEYAKQAIRYHIMDYLLKPISETELNNCLKKAALALQHEQDLSNEIPLINLINKLCGSADTSGFCSVLAIRAAGNSPALWAEESSRYFAKQLFAHNGSNTNYQYYLENPRLLILGARISGSSTASFSKDFVMSKLTKSVGAALSDSEEEYQIRTVTGLGTVTEPSVAALKKSYQQALQIVSRLDLYPSGSLFETKCSVQESCPADFLSPKKEFLMRILGKWNQKYLDDILQQHFSALAKRKAVTAELLYQNAMELLMIFQDFAREGGIPDYRELTAPLTGESTLKKLGSIQEFSDFFCSLFTKLAEGANRDTQPPILTVLSEIKTCIEEEYSRNITLTLFSDRYHLTKEYLSKQFKEYYGYGIYEYLLTFRMEKAKELLANSGMKIQAVSDYVGYTDTNYFSKAFKTYYGISPREYRQQALKDEDKG